MTLQAVLCSNWARDACSIGVFTVFWMIRRRTGPGTKPHQESHHPPPSTRRQPGPRSHMANGNEAPLRDSGDRSTHLHTAARASGRSGFCLFMAHSCQCLCKGTVKERDEEA
ncbi:hypothetical protein DPEC_G00344790 [Dallia pectoralis]|uniref:Uncharacterized protein n=1 Tax=Dallia pectoralis TaxID=75939 RepID=A0ACC2F3H2_DALPE|nr:hypothetical protein DPEC_G00344790 [Dallia pectoralis]